MYGCLLWVHVCHNVTYYTIMCNYVSKLAIFRGSTGKIPGLLTYIPLHQTLNKTVMVATHRNNSYARTREADHLSEEDVSCAAHRGETY